MTFKDVYKFPLIADVNGCFIWTDNSVMAFMLLFDDNYALAKYLVDRINGGVEARDNMRPFKVENGVVMNRLGHELLLVRGWGHLTGKNALHLPIDEAVNIQDEFLEFCVNQLNKQL